MSDLTAKDIYWFRMANAGSYSDKRRFYDFKARFLKRFATPDGFDLQHVDHHCWTCDGTGLYADETECRSCQGTGIHHTNDHWLERWKLGNDIFHVPYFCSPPLHLQQPVREYEGLIKHKDVDDKAAYRCFLRLLVRHEPATFYHHVIGLWRDGFLRFRAKLVWKLIRIRNKLDLFPAIEDDSPPF